MCMHSKYEDHHMYRKEYNYNDLTNVELTVLMVLEQPAGANK